MNKNWVIVNDGELRYPVLAVELDAEDTERSLRAMTAREYDAWAMSRSAMRNEDFVEAMGTEELNKTLDGLVRCGVPEWFVPYHEKVSGAVAA